MNGDLYLQNIMPILIYAANGGDIPKTFDNIAESPTNAIRSGPKAMSHNGTVYRTEFYMRVDWHWLTYPVALLSLVSDRLPTQISLNI